jgi:hypothetical protein
MPRERGTIWELFLLPVFDPVADGFADPKEKIPNKHRTYCLACLEIHVTQEMSVDDAKVRSQQLSPGARRSRQQVILDCELDFYS